MAKGDKQSTMGAADVEELGGTAGDAGEGSEEIAGVWARTMKPNETIEGRYLGYDETTTKWGPRKRHQFIDDHRGEASTGEAHCVFGAADLDNKLLSATLGKHVTVTRLPRAEDVKRITFRVAQSKAPAKRDGLIGRGSKE